MKVFKVTDPVFKTEPLFVLGCTHEELGRYLKRWHVGVGENVQHVGQMFTFDRIPWRVVWVQNLPVDVRTLGVLLHEVFHLVTRICQDKGVPIQAQTELGYGDETGAYLYEFFAKEAIRRAGILRRRR